MTIQQLDLTLIATGQSIEVDKLQVGDTISGYYLNRYPFQAVVTANRSGWMRQSGQNYFLCKYAVKLLTECERPQNGLFLQDEEILIELTGNRATLLVMHSR